MPPACRCCSRAASTTSKDTSWRLRGRRWITTSSSGERCPVYRGRFAPSPTGPLHFGSLVAAFGSWLLARHAGGEWIVRIEDLDPPREIAGASERQLRTLQVFGLESDVAVVRQSALGDRYRAVLDRLLASGQAFVCHCSRSDLAADARVHRRCTSGACRNDPAIRFRVPSRTTVRFDDLLQGSVEQQIDTAVGDFVLRRTDGLWAYQLAVVVDDAAQGITDVVRGADLLDSTPRQILLQRAIGVPTPRYAHLPLVVDAAGHKLSKSTAAIPVDDDAPLAALQAAWSVLGQTAGALAGATSVSTLLTAAIRDFHPAGIPRGPVATPA